MKRMTAQTKSTAIRELHAARPHLSPSEIAAELGCTRQHVWAALNATPTGKPRGQKARARKRGERYRVSVELEAAERKTVQREVERLHGRTVSSVIGWCVRR